MKLEIPTNLGCACVMSSIDVLIFKSEHLMPHDDLEKLEREMIQKTGKRCLVINSYIQLIAGVEHG